MVRPVPGHVYHTHWVMLKPGIPNYSNIIEIITIYSVFCNMTSKSVMKANIRKILREINPENEISASNASDKDHTSGN